MNLSPRDLYENFKGNHFLSLIKKKGDHFFWSSNHSRLLLYKLPKFQLKKASVFLHPYSFVSSISFLKSRIFLGLGSSLHLLEALIPITRLRVFQFPISWICIKKTLVFCFCEKEKKAVVFDAFSLKVLSRIFFPKCIQDVKIEKQNPEFWGLYIGFINGKIEIWNLMSYEKIFSIIFPSSYLTRFFIPIEKSKKIAIEFKTGNLVILDLEKKQNSFFLRSNEKSKVNSVFFFSIDREGIFFSTKKSLFFWKTSNNQIIQKNFSKIEGRVVIKQVNFPKNFFLILNSRKNSFSLIKFEKGTSKFYIVKDESGFSCPIREMKPVNNSKGVFIFSNNQSFSFLETNYFQDHFFLDKKISSEGLKIDFPSRTNFFSEEETKKLLIKQIQANRDSFDLNQLTLVFSFFFSRNLWVWEKSKRTLTKIFLGEYFDLKKKEKISLVKISPQGNNLLICFSKRLLVSIRIYDQTLLKRVKIHQADTGNHPQCKIIGLDFDRTGRCFVIGCSHGFVELWSSEFKLIKRLNLGKKIYGIRWESKNDSIFFFCENHDIYLIYPENFSYPKIFIGHHGKINDLKLWGNSKFLVTSSMDCSIKIWQLSQNSCINSSIGKFPSFSLGFDLNEKYLFTTHRNTIGIGVWEINNNLRCYISKGFPEKIQNPDKKNTENTTSIFSKTEKNLLMFDGNFGDFFQGNYSEKTFPKKEPVNKTNLIQKLKILEKMTTESNQVSKKSDFKVKPLIFGEKTYQYHNLSFFGFSKLLPFFFDQGERTKNIKKFEKDYLVVQAIFIEVLIDSLSDDFFLAKNFHLVINSFQNLLLDLIFHEKIDHLFKRTLVEIKRLDFLLQNFFK